MNETLIANSRNKPNKLRRTAIYVALSLATLGIAKSGWDNAQDSEDRADEKSREFEVGRAVTYYTGQQILSVDESRVANQDGDYMALVVTGEQICAVSYNSDPRDRSLVTELDIANCLNN